MVDREDGLRIENWNWIAGAFFKLEVEAWKGFEAFVRRVRHKKTAGKEYPRGNEYIN